MTAPVPVGWRERQLHQLDVATGRARALAAAGDPRAVEWIARIALLAAQVEYVATRDGQQ